MRYEQQKPKTSVWEVWSHPNGNTRNSNGDAARESKGWIECCPFANARDNLTMSAQRKVRCGTCSANPGVLVSAIENCSNSTLYHKTASPSSSPPSLSHSCQYCLDIAT
eukprot:5384899-Amphidinium_carterae.1